MHIIRTFFKHSEYYDSRYQIRCIENDIYTGPRRVKLDKVIPIQVTSLKNDKSFHYEINSFNFIPQKMAEKNNNILTIKASFATRIVYPAIFLLSGGNYEALFVCDQSVITFGTRKIIGL